VLKLAPVVLALNEPGRRTRARVCLSGQHPDVARKVAAEVGVVAAVELDGEGGPFTLSESLSRILSRLGALFTVERPRGVVVQGDTTTALAGALAGFQHGVPVFHVEAGLRTSNPLLPFPEEMNRRLISRLAALHFAPTEHAKKNLLAEGLPAASIAVTGNTIVDALAAFGRKGAATADSQLGPLPEGRHRLLVTLHRRENHDAASGIARAVRRLAARSDVEVAWIRHANTTSRAALEALSDVRTVRVLEPQPYATFVALLAAASVVLTDSGGVQEEAPALGVPVVVLRAETDRPEAVTAGNAIIAGSDEDVIVKACTELLDDPETRAKRSHVVSPFGDGHAASRIAALVEAHYSASGSA
jgi:UDP-N-acetylglucosamine 2-epimerase (non-hydrolysing)